MLSLPTFMHTPFNTINQAIATRLFPYMPLLSRVLLETQILAPARLARAACILRSVACLRLCASAIHINILYFVLRDVFRIGCD